MLYFLNATIIFVLALLDLSFLPRLMHFAPRPLLVLPFLAILSLRDRTISPLIAAALTGLVYDAAVGSHSLTYTLAFVVMTLVAKLVFSAAQNYSYPRSLVILVLLALFVSLLGSFDIFQTAYADPSLYISLIVYVLISLGLLALYGYVGEKYFDHLEKTTMERYR